MRRHVAETVSAWAGLKPAPTRKTISLGPLPPSSAPVLMDLPSRIVFHDHEIFTKESSLNDSTRLPGRVFCIEVGQIATGLLPSE